MTRTYNRQPISVSTSSKDYPEQRALVQAEFKGLCDDKNDSTIDQSTFVSVNNMLVDDDGLLISRPPLKSEGIHNIENEWQFGNYVLRYVREVGDTYYGYLTCVSHNMITSDTSDKFSKLYWHSDGIPDLHFAHIEDKIFIWIDKSLYVLNTSGEDGKLYFEDAKKYIYVPITKQVVNGVEQDYESPNLLTDCHKKRHLYNAVSGLNERELEDKKVIISYNGKKIQETTYDKELLYFPSLVNGNKIIDVVDNIFLSKYLDRYYVTFGTNIQRELPIANELLYGPVLTRDGLNAMAITKNGILKCELVVQGSESKAFTWVNIGTIPAKLSSVYHAYFLTDDTYVFTYFDTETPSTESPSVGGTRIAYKYPSGDTYIAGNVRIPNALSAFRSVIEIQTIGDTRIAYIYSLYERAVLGTMTSGITPVNGYKISLFSLYYIDDIMYDPSIIRGPTDLLTVPFGTLNTLDIYLTASYDDIDMRVTSASYADSELESTGEGDSATTTNVNYLYLGSTLSIVYRAKRYNNKTEEYLNMTYIDSYDIQLKYKVGTTTVSTYGITSNDSSSVIEYDANIFKLSSEKLVTDKYIHTDRVTTINDNLLVNYQPAAYVKNRDRIKLSIVDENGNTVIKEYFITVVDTDGSSLLDTNNVKYGDIIVLSEGDNKVETLSGAALSRKEQVVSSNGIVKQNMQFTKNNRFKLRSVGTGDLTSVHVKYGDDVIFTPYGMSISIYNKNVVDFYHQNNTYIEIAGTSIFAEQTLKIEEVPRVIPLTTEVLKIGDKIYTNSFINTNDKVTIDEMLDGRGFNITEMTSVDFKKPTLHKQAGEHFFYFEDGGKHLLEVTQTKRNENGEFLLYLPKSAEQVFANEITNMHPLAENTMAVFTPREIFYSTYTTTDEGNILFYKPILSKLPTGCRKGNDVITALDGSAIIFPTERGITAMSPEQFIATSEPTLSYLSDTIQDKYYHFYNDEVKNFKGNDYKPDIKIITYRYWILFYRYMDREILALDTRGATWWVWSVPYPIKKLINDGRLHLLLHVEGIAFNNHGTRFLWADRESSMYLNDKDFPELLASEFKYKDDVLSDSLSGDYESYYENEYIGERKIAIYASPIIKWHFVSPKLHFNAINNYKAVKGINLNVKGMEALTAKLSTKVFRDTFHPEKSESMEININDLRTFVKRLNLSHVTNFQYRLENDVSNEAQYQLKLNFLAIKFEVKERLK